MMIIISGFYDYHHSRSLQAMKVSEVRQSMVQHMTPLLAQKGLQGASFTEVLKASGAPRGSLYHHFPGGKDELVLAAVEAAGNEVVQFLDRLEGQTAETVVRGFLRLWHNVLTGSDLSAGCAVVAVTVAADSVALRQSAAVVFSAWRVRLAGLLVKGGVAEMRAPALAALIVAGAEGAVALARAEGSTVPFDLAATELVAMVRASLG